MFNPNTISSERYRSYFNQCCGSGSVSGSDPDSNGVPGSISGSRRAKITHKHLKKLKKLIVFKFWMFSFEGPCSLDVLYGGLEISKLKFLIQ
jgi:hypothetical protein